MSISVGIVGLPNVGKSTLFKALTKKEVDIQNYPFCTIEPNVGIVPVPDERLEKLSRLMESAKTIPTVIEVVDIAGLVKGAHEGEGLGNQFLSHIREVDGIIQVLRVFAQEDVVHVEGSIDALRDMETIHTELLLKDQETIQRRLHSLEKEVRGGEKGAEEKQALLQELLRATNEGILAFAFLRERPEGKEFVQHELQLLTAKPFLYLLNGREEDVPSALIKKLKEQGSIYVVADAKEEAEFAGLSLDEQKELGFQSVFPKLIQAAYESLNLITFLTGGPAESRAWTVRKGALAPEAGAAIHSDFQTKFIKALVVHIDRLLEAGSLATSAAKGWLRTEGKEYVMQDGDVMEFKHS